ncbi:GNAT family N-acetyltransferase [Winogradskyella echinorum]|uniref:GNAT family N-acetyltransferase n=1 Tax=Winogradskyella echinorum TaxID=538189 RepID=A0ABR6Y5Q8_9FLAO|nr:GNAT family N-acetyltransferase [Winogradskyella echinorum]MBC3848039.1 GNAT family N-acetyltransferase [Winogradskyella echinorum]MBC5752387.1 GNAT family N-acetyltransferase [Winogradskyella echinorum]
MRKDTIVIREIELKDNPKIAQAIRSVLIEYGVPKVGTAYEDKALDCMTETYDQDKMTYFVVAKGDDILGGAGISPLDNYEGNVCELQKMYFMSEARGKGLGSQMMAKCLEFAKQSGFEQCYLETLPYMVEARKLYRKVGFESLDKPLGNTGHYSCTEWMIKDL